MRFRPANISLINRRHYLPRLLLTLSSKRQMQKQKPPHRFADVDRVTPYHFRFVRHSGVKHLVICPTSATIRSCGWPQRRRPMEVLNPYLPFPGLIHLLDIAWFDGISSHRCPTRLKNFKLIALANENAPEKPRRQNAIESFCARILLGSSEAEEGTPLNSCEPIFTCCAGRAENVSCLLSTPPRCRAF